MGRADCGNDFSNTLQSLFEILFPQSPAKCNTHLAESLFQTHSNLELMQYFTRREAGKWLHHLLFTN
ncbi:DUF6783 domain-containing protein [Blautia sp. 210702-DFI.1.159]|uniref:DUF6783 domain-containing protein n=1 Tax=Blautia sp. 210702-DFI.1.159 TaxID=2883262 RepID=UPI003FA46C20